MSNAGDWESQRVKVWSGSGNSDEGLADGSSILTESSSWQCLGQLLWPHCCSCKTKKSQNDTDQVQIMQIIRWFPLHNALHQSEQKAQKYTCKKRHLALVSVMIFGSCHLTYCQLNQLVSNSEAEMLPKKLRSTLALQIARSAFCTGNQCMICLHWNGKDLMQCVFSSDTFWRIQAVWAGQRSGTWRSERVSWVQDSHHRLGPQNFLVYTHCEVVTIHSIPIQWLH